MAAGLESRSSVRDEHHLKTKDCTMVVVRSLLSDTRDNNEVQEDKIQNLASLVNATHIVSSPYQDLSNQLNLQSLAAPHRLLAIALSCLSATRLDYATAPYLDSFNWPTVFSALRALCIHTTLQWRTQDFYLVIFRSQLRRGSDRERLCELDKRSHEEACVSGGLLKYWFGSPDGQMRNLATCIWSKREDAVVGGAGPWHRQARAAAREMYEQITFETFRFTVEDGAESWRLKEYSE